jgi:hypothetical protein
VPDGFLSESGFIPQLNASMSVIANEDGNGNYVKQTAFCSALQILYADLAGKTVDFGCRSGKVMYKCFAKQCVTSFHGKESKSACETTCK